MTEAEWLAATDPDAILDFLRGKESDRKLRLFALACCRSVWHRLPDKQSRVAVDVVERYADGLASDAERLAALDAADPHKQSRFGRETPGGGPKNPVAAAGYADADFAAYCAAVVTAEIEGDDSGNLTPRQARQLLDIFGNPFRPVAVDPSWLTSTVVVLAEGIYQERAFDRMPLLADALQDAGCDRDDILNHCRQPGEHVRGCWAVDLLLGKA